MSIQKPRHCWKLPPVLAHTVRLNMEIWRRWRVCGGVVSTSWWLSVPVTSTLPCLFLSICAGEFRIPRHPVSSKRKQQIIFPSLKQDNSRGIEGEEYLLVWVPSGWLTQSHFYRFVFHHAHIIKIILAILTMLYIFRRPWKIAILFISRQEDVFRVIKMWSTSGVFSGTHSLLIFYLLHAIIWLYFQKIYLSVKNWDYKPIIFYGPYSNCCCIFL